MSSAIRASADDGDADRTDAVQRAMDAITGMIGQRRLLPGQQLRQEDLAQQLGVSRGPVREALKALSAQQIVSYERNHGYFVTQFSADEVEQIYRLRTFAERELLMTVTRPTARQLRRLRAINAAIAKSESYERLSELNDEFHAEIFGLSPLRVLAQEVDRWWKLTAGYRMLSLSIVGGAVTAAEHDEILGALETFDREKLVAAADSHRARSAINLRPLLPGG